MEGRPLLFKELIVGAERFILSRRKETGGFGSTPRLPATVEDTYFALAGLKTCGGLRSDVRTLNFLLEQDFRRMSPEVKVKWLKSLLWLGGSPPGDFKSQIKKCLKRPPQRLSALAALAEIERLLGAEPGELLSLRIYVRRLTFRTLRDLYYLFKILEEDTFSAEVCNTIIGSQNPDGGFGFFQGTTSYLENTYFACRLMKALGLRPRDPEGLKFFVLNTHRKDGGFARAPGGVSFLETTYYGLWILLRFPTLLS
ncbi:hypothetical protein TDIS_0433 [Thermosulfurimonas dismutans]|uniref:Prenyltransferase alpha-alpha toroid domain-containing protein n=1 Tax=Thermosulfurimonas dismutans TaxID=999894 RepID=A0A179D5G8_9BACT|nr:hypothetical protein TDIS_0433 [Thermosulfurimonas dismutans]